MGLRAGFRDPSPEDAAACRVELAFWSIVGARVKKPLFFGVEDEVPAIEFADLPEHLALCGVEKDVFLAKWKEIGAFPHFAGIDKVSRVRTVGLAGSERMEIFPGTQVLGTIKQNLAAPATLAGTDAHEPGVLFTPKTRIAEAGEKRIVRWKQNGCREFVEGAQVRLAGRGEALGFEKIVSAIAESGVNWGNGFHRGVKKSGDTFVKNSAT